MLLGTDTTTGTWTNATEIEVLVHARAAPDIAYRRQRAGGANSNQISYSALTLADTGGASGSAGFAGHRNRDNGTQRQDRHRDDHGAPASVHLGLERHTLTGVTSFAATTTRRPSTPPRAGARTRSRCGRRSRRSPVLLASRSRHGQVPATTHGAQRHAPGADDLARRSDLRVLLYEGATLRSYARHGSLTTSLADYMLAIPDADAATIGSYADLELRLQGFPRGRGDCLRGCGSATRAAGAVGGHRLRGSLATAHSANHHTGHQFGCRDNADSRCSALARGSGVDPEHSYRPQDRTSGRARRTVRIPERFTST